MVDMDEAARLAAARDLVIRTSPTGELVVPETSPLPLDNYAPLLVELVECQAAVKFWTNRLDRLKAGLSAILGDASRGTIEGAEVVSYEPVDRFNGTAFKKEYPNLWRAYTHRVTKEELDVEMLKAARPDLYAKFQVRPLRITYEPVEKKQ